MERIDLDDDIVYSQDLTADDQIEILEYKKNLLQAIDDSKNDFILEDFKTSDFATLVQELGDFSQAEFLED